MVAVARTFDELELEYYRPLGSPTKFLQALVRHFSRLKDEAITPEEYSNYAERLVLDKDQQKFVAKRDGDDPALDAKRIQELARAYSTYNQLLRNAGALDFGDLILCTMTLFRERPAVLEQYRQQFQQILVDEFQDTNWAQYALIKMLAAPRNNLTVVGDDDQSIYKFRGASIANIPRSNMIFLMQPRWCSQKIIAAHRICSIFPTVLFSRTIRTGLRRSLRSPTTHLAQPSRSI